LDVGSECNETLIIYSIDSTKSGLNFTVAKTRNTSAIKLFCDDRLSTNHATFVCKMKIRPIYAGMGSTVTDKTTTVTITHRKYSTDTDVFSKSQILYHSTSSNAGKSNQLVLFTKQSASIIYQLT